MTSKETIEELTKRNVETIARIESVSRSKRTKGELVSDAIARCIGSWTFIITQACALMTWMAVNAVAYVKHWDPYPFILLNLGLSFQAAFAGPIIMMSQNRQARFAEKRNELDLQINLLAEQETTEMLRLLRLLCEKTGIPASELSASELLSKKTNPDALIKQIAKTAGETGRI